MAFGKKAIVCKLGDVEEAKPMYTYTNVLTDKNYCSQGKLNIYGTRTDN